MDRNQRILKYTYEITVNLVKLVGFERTGINGVLIKPKNKKEFEELAKDHFRSAIPIVVKCDLCKKIWNTTPRAIKRCCWCGRCNYSSRRLKPEDLEAIAKKKNLKLISKYEEYQNLLSILEWRCRKCFHNFKSNTANVERASTPCPKCFKPYQLIIWDKKFENELLKKIKFIITNLPIEINNLIPSKKFLFQKSLKLWRKLLQNGLKPEHMGADRNSLSLAFSIIYFIVLAFDIKLKTEQNLSTKAIFSSLGDKIKDLGLTKKTQFHAAPSKLYEFVPDEYKEIFDQRAKFFELTYGRIKKFVEEILKGNLITTVNEFNVNKENDKTTPVHTKIKISCIRNHIWTTTYSYLKWHGSWCPDCAQGRYEKIIRWYIHKIFSHLFNSKIKFPKTNLKQIIGKVYENNLINSFLTYSHYDGYEELFVENITIKREYFNLNHSYKKNYKLLSLNRRELRNLYDKVNLDYSRNFFKENDCFLIEFPYGYIELKCINGGLIVLKNGVKRNKMKDLNKNLMKLAFEFNGIQHYNFPNYCHSTLYYFLNRISNDLLKKKISIDNNIILLEIPYWINPDMNVPKKIQTSIVEEISKKTNIYLNRCNLPDFNHITQGYYINEAKNFYKDLSEF